MFNTTIGLLKIRDEKMIDFASGFNEHEKRLIEYLIQQGYRYAKFATSVKTRGWCSKKQLETMRNMRSDIDRRKDYFAARAREEEIEEGRIKLEYERCQSPHG